MANGATRKPRAGHYRPTVYRPELVARAQQAGILLIDMKARRIDGADFVSGFDLGGDLHMWHQGRSGEWQQVA